MEIRRMQADDLEAVARLHLDAYKVEWSLEGAKKYIDKFFRFEPESCYVAAEPDGRVTGAVLGYSFEKETGLTLFIQEVIVHPEFRERTYGKRLIEKLRESLEKKASTVKIKPLVKADTGTLNFYNSLGFERDKAVSFSFDED